METVCDFYGSDDGDEQRDDDEQHGDQRDDDERRDDDEKKPVEEACWDSHMESIHNDHNHEA